jgi:hypothetical protein
VVCERDLLGEAQGCAAAAGEDRGACFGVVLDLFPLVVCERPLFAQNLVGHGDFAQVVQQWRGKPDQLDELCCATWARAISAEAAPTHSVCR